MDRESDLLDITEAAELLKVSTASLRRWSNAGRLTCLRIGGRRERRFRRSDLLAFLEPQAPENDSGHLCGLYTRELVRTRLAAAFLLEGLTAGSVCFLAAAKDVQNRVRALIRRRHPQLRRDIADGHLVLLELADYASLRLDLWQAQFETAWRAGARSIRVVGDVSAARFARRSTFDELLDYEAAYERRFGGRFPVTTLCLYDARTLSGVEATEVLRAHGDNFATR